MIALIVCIAKIFFWAVLICATWLSCQINNAAEKAQYVESNLEKKALNK